MTHVMGPPLMDVTRARDGWIWHGFGVAMTDDDTNEETARPPPNDATSDLSSVLNGVLTHSAETLKAWGHHQSLRRPIFMKAFCKSIKHLVTLKTTWRTWSAR